MVSPLPLPREPSSGLEQVWPRELAEVGEVALRAGYNHHVASHVSDRLDVEGLGSLQSLRAFLVGKDEAALGGLVKDMVEQTQGLWAGRTPLLATQALLYVFEYALEDTEDSSGQVGDARRRAAGDEAAAERNQE